MRAEWDIIIVGGGSAGCVLARRLSQDADISVLLVEAGETASSDAEIASPMQWPHVIGGRFDWRYHSHPQSGLGGRVLGQPRGKGLGGSSLINALGFQRGPMQAYDRWAAETGDPGWSAAGLLPYFKRLETASSSADFYRGGDGPLHILALQQVAARNPLAEAAYAAAVESGYAPNPDWNGADAEGAVWAQYTMRDGHRHDAATAFLEPARGRPNLDVMTGARVSRLVFEGRRCIGIEIGGGPRMIRALREIVLSAGAIDSPKLLLLSGIGPADALRRLGITPVADLPGVGAGLRDHPLLPGLLLQSRRPIPPSRYNHCETVAVGRTSHAPGWADMQLMTLSIPSLDPSLGPAPENSFSLVPALMCPRSSGSLSLRDRDPRTPARIDPAYLTEPQDVDAMIQGLEMARALAASAPLRQWIAREVFPSRDVTGRQALEAYVRRVVSPFYHPVSTCRMGADGDPLAVVAPDCRLRGIDGIRVVDASIFPSIPQAMTHAAVLAVAERAADLIAGNLIAGHLSTGRTAA